MNLNDHDTPPPTFDNAPRPKTSQAVAAQKRARQDDERRTTNDEPAIRRPHPRTTLTHVAAR